MLRISVITVCLNPGGSLDPTLESVRAQHHSAVEHVVIDGGSTDGTLERLVRHAPEILVSERDGGIYPAMEKGARLATGDILYFLNAGDQFFDPEVLGDVAAFFERTKCDAAFGNLLPVSLENTFAGDHPAFLPGRSLDFSYFNNRRRFYDECIHHQATFYARRIFDRCSFVCESAVASGEYHLNMCAFVRHGYALTHMPRMVARFALGGHSTRDFEAEWERFVAARDELRRRFFPLGPKVPISKRDEYLLEPPGLKNQMRILLRQTGHHARMSELRVKARLMLRRLKAA